MKIQYVIIFLTLLLTACDTTPDDEEDNDQGGGNPENNFHPAGYALPSQHGLEFNLASQDCASCHGVTLAGQGDATSCDLCHTPGEPTLWRTDCTFCHGGTDNMTGAPPENINGSTDFVGGQFSGHTAHVSGRITEVMACTECHTEVNDLLDPGHVLDETAGVAEVDMSNGISADSTYAALTCSNNYCHGNGQAANGEISQADELVNLACNACHADNQSNDQAFNTMSGAHRRHLRENDITCVSCHQQVTQDNVTIANVALHIDGNRSINFDVNTITWNAEQQTCTGPCHGENHNNEDW